MRGVLRSGVLRIKTDCHKETDRQNKANDKQAEAERQAPEETSLGASEENCARDNSEDGTHEEQDEAETFHCSPAV